MSTRIGTLGEGHLHATLKTLVCEPGAVYEVPVEGLIVDVVNPGGLVEIQTSGFTRLRPKLERLLPGHSLRVVLPVAGEKFLVKVEEDAVGRRELSRRRSPKRSPLLQGFAELVSIAPWLLHPHLTVELWLTREEELRIHRPGKAWRRQGWTVLERRLLAVLEVRAFCGAADWAALLPYTAGEAFDSAELAEQLRLPRRLAQQVCYTLHHAGLLERLGKRGRAWEYSLAEPGAQAGTGCVPAAVGPSAGA
jgi:hypothetical protein